MRLKKIAVSFTHESCVVEIPEVIYCQVKGKRTLNVNLKRQILLCVVMMLGHFLCGKKPAGR
jgi:hypothetical protein